MKESGWFTQNLRPDEGCTALGNRIFIKHCRLSLISWWPKVQSGFSRSHQWQCPWTILENISLDWFSSFEACSFIRRGFHIKHWRWSWKIWTHSTGHWTSCLRNCFNHLKTILVSLWMRWLYNGVNDGKNVRDDLVVGRGAFRISKTNTEMECLMHVKGVLLLFPYFFWLYLNQILRIDTHWITIDMKNNLFQLLLFFKRNIFYCFYLMWCILVYILPGKHKVV